MSSELTSWRRYNQRIKSASKVKHPKLNVFAARYAIAQGASQVRFAGVSDSVSESYAVALQVTLAYSALESLESALGESGRLTVTDARLAEAFRQAAHRHMMESLLVASSIDSRLRRNLKGFLDGHNDNLRWIAYALRNLMCHGVLTAGALTLSSSQVRRRMVQELADAILRSADTRFTRYVQRLR